MSSFALHPVPTFDDLPAPEPPDEPRYDRPPARADEPATDELPCWGDTPVSRSPSWGGGTLRYAGFALEADLQRFCRSAALSRVARDYEGVAAARTLLEFAQRSGDDEILRWGPTRVQAFLRGGDPQGSRRSVSDRERLLRVLRALIHYGHESLGVDPAWSMLALAAIEAGADHYLHEPPYDPAHLQRARLAALAQLVGGSEALAALDDTPLAAIDTAAGGAYRPVDASDIADIGDASDIGDTVGTTGNDDPGDNGHLDTGSSEAGSAEPLVPAALVARADEIVTLTEGFADAHLGLEFAAACAALVRRVTTEAPVALFRRDPRMTAAGIVWIVGRGNGLMQPQDDVHGLHVARHFGVERGSYGRMHYLARDVGRALVDGGETGLALVIPDPAMQLAATRRAIIRARDELAAECRGGVS